MKTNERNKQVLDMAASIYEKSLFVPHKGSSLSLDPFGAIAQMAFNAAQTFWEEAERWLSANKPPRPEPTSMPSDDGGDFR